MKSNKVTFLLTLVALTLLIAQPSVWSGENPWDGDSSPSGNTGRGYNGGGSGSGSGNSTTPAMTRFTPQTPYIDATIQSTLTELVSGTYRFISVRLIDNSSVTVKAKQISSNSRSTSR